MPANTSARYQYEGTETTETSIVRVGGATDPAGQTQSRRIATTANTQWLRPYKGEPLAVWNPTAGANVTATVYGAASGLSTTPNNDEIWAEFEYLGLSSSSLGSIATTTKSNVLATGTAVTSDSSTWNNVPGVVAFNSTTASGVTLSGGNLTVTHSSGVSNSGAFVAAANRAGKFYFEMTINAAGIDVLGLSIPGTLYSSVMTSANTMRYDPGSGSITIFSVSTGKTIGIGSTGNVIGVAVDLGAGLIWFRRQTGNWNGTVGADPATGALGLSFPVNDFVPVIATSGASGASATANFGATTYANAAPSGFGNWIHNWYPFKLITTLSAPQPGQAGYIHARVRAAKFGVYYIDPQIELSPAAGGTSNVATAYNYKSSRYTYEGTETTETTIVRTGGTADPTGQVQSRKIVTSANAQWLRPFKAEPYAVWNATTGSITATIYGNAATLPLTNEIWAEFEFLGSGSSTLGSIVTTTKANVLATGTSVASDASTWSGGTNSIQIVRNANARPGRIYPRAHTRRQGERDLLHRSANLPGLTMTLDFSALMYDPIYDTLGVPATLTQGESEISLTVVDNTRPVTIATVGNPAEVRSAGPGAYARVQELNAKGFTRAQYIDATLAFNGRTWIVRSYEFTGNPNGEEYGEVRFLLKEAAVG